MLFQADCGVPVAAVDVRCYAADESEMEHLTLFSMKESWVIIY